MIYQPGYDWRSSHQYGEWGKRNVLGRLLLIVEIPFAVAVCVVCGG